jgi:hypothetical protein
MAYNYAERVKENLKRKTVFGFEIGGKIHFENPIIYGFSKIVFNGNHALPPMLKNIFMDTYIGPAHV